MRNNLFAKFIITLMLVALLLSSSKASGTFALAEEVSSELLPVFDTQIYQFTDYVEESLTDPQKGILYLLLGAWVCAQGGMNEYELVDEYTTSDGVRGWLKSTGITLYNQMLTLAGGRIYDPLTGTDLTPLLSTLAGYALGAATKASKYQTENDFINDVETSEHYFVPYDPVLQQSINAYFGRKGGLWNWQFNSGPFITDLTFYTTYLNSFNQSAIDSWKSSQLFKIVRVNFFNQNISNQYFSGSQLNEFHNLFINTNSHSIYVMNDNGIALSNYYFNRIFKYVPDNEVRQFTDAYYSLQMSASYNPSNYNRIVDVARAFFNNVFTLSGNDNVFYSDFIDHVYAGENWATKQEVFNLDDLNFKQNDVQSYNQVPENTLLDIKGLLVDILDNTDLFQIVIDNLFKPDGTLNIDLPDIKVSINLPDTNPLPVNLNDIAEYTDNEYLDIVKERVNAFSDTIGSFVAFWHNIDYEIVYAVGGASIVVLLGAFIGKWGHS